VDPRLEITLERLVDGLKRVLDRIVSTDAGSALGVEVSRTSREEAPLRQTEVAAAVCDAIAGMGPLEPLLRDPDVTDVLVNGPSDIWVERSGDLERVDARFPSVESLTAAVERALLPLGLRLDRRSPAVDARLPDGSRLHAIVPPAAVDGPMVAIRRFTAKVLRLDDLVAAGSIDADGAEILGESVRTRRNLIVSGATGAGKTTLLNVLSRLVPGNERIVTVEEAAELDLVGHTVRLEARPPNAEGAGEVSLRTLIRHALRMRPDRIIVGEVRGPEALDLVQAMNTGHAGSMGTVHSSGAEEALWRIETLAAMAPEAVPYDALHRMLYRSVDEVVHVERRDGRRQITSIAQVDHDAVMEMWSSR
jgi:pilus assembly protein CpaF